VWWSSGSDSSSDSGGEVSLSSASGRVSAAGHGEAQRIKDKGVRSSGEEKRSGVAGKDHFIQAQRGTDIRKVPAVSNHVHNQGTNGFHIEFKFLF
jgi:hypothetical protein